MSVEKDQNHGQLATSQLHCLARITDKHTHYLSATSL